MHYDDTEEQSVAYAVQRLQELGKRIEVHGLRLQERDVGIIDEVIDAVQELDKERVRAHDLLEAESIRSSILRHEMKTLHAVYRKEIQDAIENARQSIKDLVEELKKRIEDVGRSADQLAVTLQSLEKENALLVPERDRLREKHEEIIVTLNQRMAEKAVNQIALNETRDRLRATNQRVLDLEDDIAQLKEDMILERAEARAECDRLRTAVSETKAKTSDQNSENATAKKKLDSLQSQLRKSEEELEVYRKQIRKYEVGRTKLEDQERALLSQLAVDTKTNEDLRNHGVEVHAEHLRREKAFQIEIEDLQARIKELGTDYKAKIEQAERLKERRKELALEAAVAEESAAVAQQRSKEVSAVLEQAQQNLLHRQEDLARTRNETERMEQDIVNLAEEHKVFVVNYNRQIEEFKEQLSKEKKDRMEVQATRDTTQKQLEEFKQTTQKYMAEVNKKVSHGKQQHANLTQEGAQLERDIKVAEDAIVAHRSQLELEREVFKQKEVELRDKLAKLRDEVAQLESKTTELRHLLATQIPVFEGTERRFNEVSQKYDTTKRDVAGKKSEKQSLEDQVKRAKATIDRLYHPQERLRLQLSEQQQQSLLQMRTQMEELRTVELDIYVAQSKLDALLTENARFKNSIEIMQNDSKELGEREALCENETDKLRRLYRFLQDLLHSNWMEDYNAGEASAARDRLTLEQFGRVLSSATKRQTTVTCITDRMATELELLARFLETVASRRPKSTRESRRPATADVALSTTSLAEDAKPAPSAETAQATEAADTAAAAGQSQGSGSGRATPQLPGVTQQRRPGSAGGRLPSARSPLPPIGQTAKQR